MTERIQQLAIEAGFIDRGSNHTAYMNFDHEKFAQLIIKECMGCAQFVGITNDPIGFGPRPIIYTSMVNDQIKKHFGD